MRILCLGDIVGSPGLTLVRHALPDWRKELAVDFVIANAENIADGSSTHPRGARRLQRAGCDVLTNGDHAWRKECFQETCTYDYVLRPLNCMRNSPGRGCAVYECGETKIAVINILCQLFMKSCDNPFDALDDALADVGDADIIICDVHGEATSEKAALAHFVDGRVTAVFGTHTHVPTADERILPEGTAFITDVGMCGAHHSIIGRSIEPVVYGMRTGQQTRFTLATEDVRLSGIVLTINDETFACESIERVCLRETV